MHKNKKKKIRQELKPPDVQMPWIGWALLSAQVCYVLIFNYLANIPLSDVRVSTYLHLKMIHHVIFFLRSP